MANEKPLENMPVSMDQLLMVVQMCGGVSTIEAGSKMMLPFLEKYAKEHYAELFKEYKEKLEVGNFDSIGYTVIDMPSKGKRVLGILLLGFRFTKKNETVSKPLLTLPFHETLTTIVSKALKGIEEESKQK